MTTLRDVADAVGCSTATVSRALNGDTRISKSRALLIREEANRLGYQANQLARSLRKQKTGYVGVVIPNLTNNYYTNCLAHLTDQLSPHGLHVVLGCHNFDAGKDAKIINSLVNRKVDALVHVPCTKQGIDGVIDNLGIPVIEIGQRSSSVNVDAVYVDDADGIAHVMQYLANLGHRRIVMIAGRQGVLGVDAQSRGFTRAVAAMDLSPDECKVVHCPANRHDCSRNLENLLDTPRDAWPTAVIGAHHLAISACLMVFRARGLQLPNDISLVGFSNDEWFEISNPPVTTYEHPFRAMSIVAAQLLISRLQPHPDQPSKRETISFDGKILERLSTGPPAFA